MSDKAWVISGAILSSHGIDIDSDKMKKVVNTAIMRYGATEKEVIGACEMIVRDKSTLREIRRYGINVTDIIDMIPRIKWLDSDAVWGLMMSHHVGSKSVIVPEAALSAFSQVFDLLSKNDMVGARMAFKSLYESEKFQQMSNGNIVPKWTLVMGDDKEDREKVIIEGIRSGLLDPEGYGHLSREHGENKALENISGKNEKLTHLLSQIGDTGDKEEEELVDIKDLLQKVADGQSVSKH